MKNSFHPINIFSNYSSLWLKHAVLLLTLLSCFFPAGQSLAGANCGGFKALNLPQDLQAVTQALNSGCPIPKEWTLGADGTRSGLKGFTATSVDGAFHKSSTPAHKPPQYYKNMACNSYEDTCAGGLSNPTCRAADNPCQTGRGQPLFSMDILNHAPTATLEAVNCLANLAGAIGGLVSGTGGGDFSGIQASGSASGNCVSGSIGICGLGGIGGSICANNKGGQTNNTTTAAGTNNGLPYTRDNPPQYVEATGVVAFDYANNPINQTSAVYFPQGGVLTTKDGTSYTIDIGGFATMTPQGVVYIGTKDGGAYADPADGIKLNPDEFVTINPTGGIAQVDSYLLRGETIGVPVDLATVGTTQGGNVAKGLAAQINVTTEKTAGATLVPDPVLGITTPVLAGSFAPPGTITTVEAPQVTSLLPAAAPESGVTVQ